MSMQRRYQIFVSSTFDDLQGERGQVWQTLIKFNYIVVGMETFPATNEEQFAYIQKQILTSDYYVLVIGARYGSMADDKISFTEREFDFAVQNKIPTLVFPIEDPSSVPVKKTDNDAEKARKLTLFRERAMRGRTVHKWSSGDNLCLGIIQSLQNATETNPRPGWTRGAVTSNEEFLSEIRDLRRENEKLKSTAAKLSSAHEGAPKIDLSAELKVEYTVSNGETTSGSINVSLESIVSQFNLTEAVEESTIEQSLRGAVSLKLDTDYVNTQVTNRIDVEKALLMLAAKNVIRLKSTPLGLMLEHGPQWIAAIGAARLQ
jgi:Domain of unknown function (DUF4062)